MLQQYVNTIFDTTSTIILYRQEYSLDIASEIIYIRILCSCYSVLNQQNAKLEIRQFDYIFIEVSIHSVTICFPTKNCRDYSQKRLKDKIFELYDNKTVFYIYCQESLVLCCSTACSSTTFSYPTFSLNLFGMKQRPPNLCCKKIRKAKRKPMQRIMISHAVE